MSETSRSMSANLKNIGIFAALLAVCVAAIITYVVTRGPTHSNGVTNDSSELTNAASQKVRFGRGDFNVRENMDVTFLNRDEALAALVIINHINCVVTKIKTFNNPMVLEEEYRNISQNGILLDVIKDEAIIDLIRDIMDAITELRIDSLERNLLKEELDQAASDALYDAIAGINVHGVGLIGTAVSVVTSVGSSAANYARAKRNLQRAYNRKTLTLDETKLRNLNLLNRQLLKGYWLIINKYNIPDIYRVTEDDIADLIDRMKDEDNSRRLSYLVANEERFKALPLYWYWRGETAYELGDFDAADCALGQYQKLQQNGCQVLRRDATTANAALIRAKILVDKKARDKDVREQLEIIVKNTADSEWMKKYFCALVYSEYLGDIARAERVLRQAIDKIEVERKNNFITLNEKYEDVFIDQKSAVFKSANVIDFAHAGDGLYLCKTLLLEHSKPRLIDERKRQAIMANIVDAENASVREKLFCYCSLDYAHALDRLIADIGKMILCKETWRNRRELRVPMSWVVARDGEPIVYLSDDVVDLQGLDLSEKSSEKKDDDKYFSYDEEKHKRCVIEDDGSRYASFTFNRSWSTRSPKYAIVLFQYKRGSVESGENCYQIAVLFDIQKQKLPVSPMAAAIGEWSGSKWKTPEKVKVRSFISREELSNLDNTSENN